MRQAHEGMGWWVGLTIGIVTFLIWAGFTALIVQVIAR